MKRELPRSLPHIIITLVIVAVGLSIVAKQLGISLPKPSPAPSAAAGRPAAASQGQGAPNGSLAGQPPSAGQAASGQGQRQAPSAAGQPASGQGPASGAGVVPGAGAGAAPRTVAVRAAAVGTGDILNYTKIHGDVVADNEIKVFPSVAGRVVERKVGIGDSVSPGSALALVDPSKVGQTFNPHTVESPVAGTVLSLPVHEGDTVTTNTVVAVIGNLARTKVSTAVPELYIGNLKIGTKAEIRFDSIPGTVFTAWVSEMDPVVDSGTRTLEIKLSLDRPDRRILAGMFATVKLATESRRNVLVAPRSAVASGAGETYVFVINDKNRVERRTVELGLEGEEYFEVLKGLSKSERVVTEGKNSVQEGSAVRVIGPEGQEAAR
ncbi:MAG: efflux RND transporter periplasmic adaptor subunit [Spirochaetota bacterium]